MLAMAVAVALMAIAVWGNIKRSIVGTLNIISVCMHYGYGGEGVCVSGGGGGEDRACRKQKR